MTTDDAGADSAPRIRFKIEKLYLREITFEFADSPQPGPTTRPNVKAQLSVSHRLLESTSRLVYEVVVSANVSGSVNDHPHFTLSVEQAGIFRVGNFTSLDQLRAVLEIECAEILYPYLREAVSSVTSRAGVPFFPGIPRFRAMYRRRHKVTPPDPRVEIE